MDHAYEVAPDASLVNKFPGLPQIMLLAASDIKHSGAETAISSTVITFVKVQLRVSDTSTVYSPGIASSNRFPVLPSDHR